MPISFLTPAQRESYGRYAASPTPDQLSRFFHLNDEDLAQIRGCRGEHNRLGFALQLSTVRYLGTFLDDPVAVPCEVVQRLANQLDISKLDSAAFRLQRYHRAPDWISPDTLDLRALLDWNRAAQCALRPRRGLAAGA
jgi:hypothetical protein